MIFLQTSKQLSDTESVWLSLFSMDQQLQIRSEGHTPPAFKRILSHISELFLQISANEYRLRDLFLNSSCSKGPLHWLVPQLTTHSETGWHSGYQADRCINSLLLSSTPPSTQGSVSEAAKRPRPGTYTNAQHRFLGIWHLLALA